MEVKCPKCRLRFDVAVPHGFTEVQCNCPRCGTPFTYKTEGKEEAEDLKPKGNGDTGSGSDVAGTETEAQEPQDIDITTDDAKPQETKDGAFRDVYMQHIFDSRGPLVIKEEYRRQSKRKAYMLVLGIMAMIVLVGLFAKGVDMFVSHFTDNDMARSEQLAADSTLGPAGGSATGSKTDSKESRGRHGRGKSHEALPRWLQGKWHAHNADGYILINIKGTDITVSDGFHSNKGTVRCKGNVLICKYVDGRTFRYNLNRKRHVIVIQDGMEMTKKKK